MKRPQMKRPQIKRPDVQVPAIVENLYRDLRDRNLLPIAALLVVAIIAVPIVLSTSSGTTASDSPAAEIVPADAPEAQAVVLAENPGLRDYKKRLDQLKATNPFTQQYQSSGLSQTTVESGSQDTSTVTSSSGVPSSSGSGSVSVSSSSGSSTVSSGSAPSSDSTPASGADTTSDTTVEQTKPKFYSWKLDIRYGAAGDVQERDNVKVMDLLSPVGVFIGASLDAKSAFFFLSSDVVSASGDGVCAPSPADCQFLTLKQGKAEDIVYQPAGAEAPTTYTLELTDIKVIKVNNPPEPK
jgi:hypothetical protein